MCGLRLKCLAGLILSMGVAVAPAQGFFTKVAEKNEVNGMYWGRFIGTGGVFVRAIETANDVMFQLARFQPNGVQSWALPVDFQRDMVVADNVTYYLSDNRVTAFDPRGYIRWTETISTEFASRKIAIDDKYVAISAVRKENSQFQQTGTLIVLDRASGRRIRTQFLLPLAARYPNVITDLKCQGGYAFISFRHDDTGIQTLYKIGLANGEKAGGISLPNSGVGVFSVDTDLRIYASGTMFRCIDGSGTGPMPIIYEKALNRSQFVEQSGEDLYLLDRAPNAPTTNMLRKIRKSDGETIWATDVLAGLPLSLGNKEARLLRLDPYSRPIISVSTPTASFSTEYIVACESSTGNPLGWIEATAKSVFLDMQVGPYGEIQTTSTEELNRGLFRRFIQPMEPVSDTYYVPENGVFFTEGDGVMDNDRYVNPVLCKAMIETYPEGDISMSTDGEFVFDSTGLDAGTYSFTYSTNRGGRKAIQTVNLVVGNPITNLSFARPQVAGQNTILATVNLARTGPATVMLSDNSANLSTPDFVQVPATSAVATFQVRTMPVVSPEAVTVTATLGSSSRTATITLIPLAPTAMAFTPNGAVRAGEPVTCRVVLNGPAPTGGVTLSVSADDSSYLEFPVTFTVPAGATGSSFIINTFRGPTPLIKKITVSMPGGSHAATLRIKL